MAQGITPDTPAAWRHVRVQAQPDGTWAVRTWFLNGRLYGADVDFLRRAAGWDAGLNYEALPRAIALTAGAAAEAALAAQERGGK